MKIDNYPERYPSFSYTTIRNELFSFRNLGSIVYYNNSSLDSLRLIKSNMYYVILVPAN